MSVDCFVDTNVLVYAVSGAVAEQRKRTRANEILDAARFGLSGQVLQEFFVTVTQKAKARVSIPQALDWLSVFEPVPCVAVDFDLVRTAIGLADRYQISYWDGAVIAAAQELDAPVLYTEDLNHGHVYGNVRVENPFMGL